ncbi:MAG TPA: LPXTG cell wall anchor domain-containing protein [Solirubrobacteraceae bacterium]|jgi:LPXTG-motif cell wall-anchored protein|nr:LPXTG cell wall anchor domain-containing protein [Solirubrobacteraceae bacterium]
MTGKKLGAVALSVGSLVIVALPAGSFGAGDLRDAKSALLQAGQQVQSGLATTVQQAGAKTDALVAKTTSAVRKTADPRANATDPPTQPPVHGTNPHGQGGPAIVDLDPSSARPLGAKPDGSDSGEDVIVGRARGEQIDGGAYHGHITIVGLFGHELAGVDSTPGQSSHGPLQGLQTSVLDPLCQSTSQQVCLSVLTANSTTTATSSTNDFAIARASLLGLGVGAAESQGNIASDANCQTAGGLAKTANVTTSTGALAQVANSASVSKSCRGQAPQVTNSSQVIGLGGTGVALPAAGCADGTPDTQAGIPALLPIICNAEDIAGATAVREALDVFALQTGSNGLLKETTAASESSSVAPPESGVQCADGIDNDQDGLIDAADPGCHTDGNAANSASYDATDNDEADTTRATTGSGSGNGNGNGNNGSGNGNGKNSGVQCADGVDNDGDGLIDNKDPGCHTDGDASNPKSYDASDNSEGGNGSGAQSLNSGTLPFTGTDVIGMAIAGLLALAGGLLLRRREDISSTR